MNRLRHAASGLAWYLALLLLIPGIISYWTPAALAGEASLLKGLISVVYGFGGVCLLLAFFSNARRRRLIFGAFVASLVVLRVYAGMPTLERILTFVTVALVIGIAFEFLRQNRPLFRDLAAANIRLAPLLTRTVMLWSPALVFIAIGLWLNHTLVDEVRQTLYESALVDQYCAISDRSAPMFSCTTLGDRLPAGAISELSLEENIALHVEALFLSRRKALLDELSSRPPGVWTNRNAVMREITALQHAVHPTAVMQLNADPAMPDAKTADAVSNTARSLRIDTFIALAWINTGPAFRVLSFEINRRLDRKATAEEISAAARIGLVRIMTNLQAETKKRLNSALQNKGESVYEARIVRRSCRVEGTGSRDGDSVIDCPEKTGQGGRDLVRVSFRDSIDRSIARWHARQERDLEAALIDTGLLTARTAAEIKTAHAKIWTRNRPLAEDVGLAVTRCGLLNAGCHLANYVKRRAERAYDGARSDIQRKAVQAIDTRADAGAASVIEQIDLARAELYAGLAEARRAIDGSIDAIAKAGTVAGALLLLWLVLAVIKSFLYVLATEVFHVRGPSEIGFESDSTAEGRYDVSTTIEIPASFSVPLNTTVVGVNQGKRTVVPQPFTAMLARILHWKWALHRGTRVGGAPIRYTQPGGYTGVMWNMKEGEEIVFRYRDLLGFSDNVRLGSTISLQLSTLLFGRYVYQTACSVGGPGLLLLSVKGQVEATQDAVEAFPLERLIAWNKHTKFRVADDRTVGAVFKDGFIVQTVRRQGDPSGLVLVGAPHTRAALVQGTVRFVKVFVVPF